MANIFNPGGGASEITELGANNWKSFYSNGSDLSLFTYDISNNSTSHVLIEFTDCESDGDVNFDGLINVVDLVSIVNFILGVSNPDSTQFDLADMNDDGLINILDVVQLVSLILN